MGAQSPLDRRFQDGHHGLFLLEFHLHLGGVNVHVNLGWVDRQVQHIQWMLPLSNEAIVRADNGAMKQTMTNKTAVDEQELLASRLSRRIRFTDKPLNGHHVGGFIHRHEALVVFGPQHPHDALAHRPGLELEQGRALMGQGEFDVCMYKRDALEFIDDMPQFHRIRFQKVPPSRNVVEQVLHLKRRAHGRSLDPFFQQFRPMTSQRCGHVV